MEVHVVTTIVDGVVMGVYTKPRRAETRRENLERDGIECQVTATLVNQGESIVEDDATCDWCLKDGHKEEECPDHES